MKQHLRSVVAGLCVAASMPPWGWWPLAFLGLALYARLALTLRGRASFSAATIFAAAWFAPAMAWMWFLTAPGYIIAVALFAALHGAAAVLAASFAPSDNAPSDNAKQRRAMILAHGLVEALRLSWPFGGVPLATLAIGQADGPFVALATVGGVIGLGFAVLWIAFSSHVVRRVLAALIAVGLLTVWDGTSSTGETVRVAFIQGGGEQGTHAIDTDPRDVFNRHLAATRTLTPSRDTDQSSDTARLDMVIWPENVINVSGRGLFVDSQEFIDIAAEAKRLQVPFVVGITEDSGDGQFTNAQVVVSADGEIIGRYDKVRRVPFGEYMPFRSTLAAMGAPVELVPRDARPGDARGWLDVPVRDRDVRVAVAISWEIFFGGRVNEGVVDGAQLILNPTNGSSYTGTILQTQQLASSRLRAREQGRWVVQVSPTGFSAFVSPDGSILDKVGITKSGVVEREISLRTGRSPYSRLGNAPYIWCALTVLIVMASRRSGLITRAPR